MTEKDRFIGLNAEGRLIHVEEEATTLHESGATPHSETIKLELDELLPLSMFLRAVGGTVKAYRMRGDPREFPHEIRTLTGKQCNLIIFPWRASQYVERLFWGSLRAVAAPIALVVMLDTTLTPTIADLAIGASLPLISGSEQTRVRSASAAIARSRALSSTSDSDNNAPSMMSIDDRSKSDVTASPVIGMSPSSSPLTSRKRLPGVEDTVSIPIQPEAGTGISLVNRQSVSIKNMLCLITGTSMCSAIFPIALRFAERGSIHVTVMVTSDRRQFNEQLIEALSAFKHAAEGINNITIEILTTPSTDTDSILEHCAAKMYDLIAFGFSDAEDAGADVIPPPLSRSHRSASMSFSGPILDGPELRRQSGVPENLATSPLPHPELSLLGNRIRERGLTSFMMVLHEPTVFNRQRRSTMWGGAALTSSPPMKTVPFASSKPKDLFTIAEERV